MSQGQADLTQGSATATETTKEPPGETPTAAALSVSPVYDVAGHQAGEVDEAQAEGTGCERHAGSASPEDIGRRSRSRVRLLVPVTSSRSSLGEPVEALDF